MGKLFLTVSLPARLLIELRWRKGHFGVGVALFIGALGMGDELDTFRAKVVSARPNA